MFTGIIQATATILRAERSSDGLILTIARPRQWKKIAPGASIAVNGVCSTVKKLSTTSLTFEYMPESLERSTIGTLTPKTIVNLEQSLRAHDRLDGHIVQGHVDTIGTITSVTREGNASVFAITPRDRSVLRLIAQKGSIAINGISLTVTSVSKTAFSVKIIPYTLEHTDLGAQKKNGFVNLETDVLAKYLDRLYAK